MEAQEKIYLWQGDAPYTAECPGQEQPSLTAFPVEGARGAIIVCPGGGYCMKAEHEGAPIARMLNSQGIAAYVLDYRVRPCHRLAPWTDARRAIRLVRSLGFAKVGILGFSAGGNLCCTAATHYDAGDPASPDPIERFSSRPDVFIPCYAVASFGAYTHLDSRKCLLGEDWENDGIAVWYSAEENVTEDTPPAFIWHTAEDGLVPVQNSLNLAKALADHGVSFELRVYPKGPHGIGLGSEWGPAGTWGSALCRYLLEAGYGK
ncbi:MAG: alpha/beta hydrolase [Clostridia bacterium]|nr:alpha/beta hydrolase [Clostridia bacterium]